MPNLPVELIAEIMDHLGDWELANAVGTVTALKRPKDWTRATLVDEAALSGSLTRMMCVVSSSSLPSTTSAIPFAGLSQVGANAIVRLGYIHILDHLLQHDRNTFDRLYGGDNPNCIPLRASASGRTEVLTWWRAQNDIPKIYGDECIDEACKHGRLDVLDWWWCNTLPHHLPRSPRTTPASLDQKTGTSGAGSSAPLYMFYTEAALENASARGHIHVLKWWKQSGLPLRVGRVMDLASKSGHTEVLDWWSRSGIEVKYDHGTLDHASRNGKVDVLSWWLHSGYRMMVRALPFCAPLQLFNMLSAATQFNEEVLLSATRHNRPEVLQWWYDSGLTVHYRICDIEEALEDAIRPGPEAREWWGKHGVDFKANNAEWMKLKILR